MMSKNITFSNYCEVCNKSFQCSEKYHKQYKCKPIKSIEKQQEPDMSSFVLQLIQQTQFIQQQQNQQAHLMEHQQTQQNQIMQHQTQMMEHQQQIIELIVNKPTVINNIDNSVKNKTINNVNIFLNEECKDAINWDDFIKNLQLPESVNAKITDIVRFSIHNQLKELGIYKRPIHYFKQKQLCIKNNDQWEENSSKNHKLFVNSLEQMKNQMIKNWEDKHPKWFEDEEQSNIGPNILAKINDNVDANKCIPHIMKQTTVDLE